MRPENLPSQWYNSNNKAICTQTKSHFQKVPFPMSVWRSITFKLPQNFTRTTSYTIIIYMQWNYCSPTQAHWLSVQSSWVPMSPSKLILWVLLYWYQILYRWLPQSFLLLFPGFLILSLRFNHGFLHLLPSVLQGDLSDDNWARHWSISREEYH